MRIVKRLLRVPGRSRKDLIHAERCGNPMITNSENENDRDDRPPRPVCVKDATYISSALRRVLSKVFKRIVRIFVRTNL